MNMTSNKPYLIRALYDWVTDNHCTPHIQVSTAVKGVAVPPQFIQNELIVFDVSPSAVRKLLIKNDAIEFDARFGGRVCHIYVPMGAVTGIFASETGEGMAFTVEEVDEEGDGGDQETEDRAEQVPKRGKPNLKIVK